MHRLTFANSKGLVDLGRMFRGLRQASVIAATAAFVAACASTPEPISSVEVPPNAGVYKVGEPYQVGDTWYYPHEQPDYDETGVASWYGPTFYGRHTADGELFTSDALTAAHRTLPMPVNVRVTNLENGKSLVVRVNDRGPFSKGRIIDVSERAAKLLGFYDKGTARVRVTYLARADLPNGEPQPDETPVAIASALPATPTTKVDTDTLDAVPGAPVAPPVEAAPMPAPLPPPPPPASASTNEVTGQVSILNVPSVTHLYVQAGAFSSFANADRLRTRLAAAGGLNISAIDRNGQRLYRVRMGPFDDVASADAALARLSALGGTDAQIIVDR